MDFAEYILTLTEALADPDGTFAAIEDAGTAVTRIIKDARTLKNLFAFMFSPVIQLFQGLAPNKNDSIPVYKMLIS